MTADQHSQMIRHHQPLLRIGDLAVSFPARRDESSSRAAARQRVISGLHLSIYPAQTLALVGETGCGKSMTALSILRLLPPAAKIDSGSIQFGGRDLLQLQPREMLKVRGSEIAMIFQEPMTSLNPVLTVGDQIIEAIQLHQRVSRRQAQLIAEQALTEVGIAAAAARLRAYPHQFSGGMRQRVMIAMALACQPKLLLADEPTTALDVTVQAQILELLHRLQEQRRLAIMLITHDLGIVAQHADVVCVMYAGRMLEYASVFDVLERPLHPYTRGLLNARPSLSRTTERLATVSEFVDQLTHVPSNAIGNAMNVRPWWPGAAHLRQNDDYVLSEVEPGHWLACCAEERARSETTSLADLAFRRTAMAMT